MQKLHKLVECLLLLMIGLPAFLGILLLLSMSKDFLWTEKAAGWAQGILTTAGIGFALYTAQGAQRHTEQLRRVDLEQKRRGVLAIASAAFDHIRTVDLDATQGRLHFFFEDTYYKGYFSHPLAALRAIPLHELLSYSMTVGLLDMINVLTKIEHFCEAHADGERNGVTLEEAYYLRNAGALADAVVALNFIQGGALGFTTEQI